MNPAADRPLVSIIVPSYKQGRFLAATLESILSQDYRPIEVLVIDGASDDGSVDILKEYSARWPELRWWSEPDRGVADAVNKGLARARGPIAAIQSSDDLYLPGAISAAVRAFAEHAEVGIVYADAQVIDEAGRVLDSGTRWRPYSHENFLCMSTFILQSSAFFLLEEARAVGGWRPDYFVADVDLWFRMLFRKPAHKVDALWSAFRRHADQRDKQTARIFVDYWRLVGDAPELRGAAWRLRLAAEAGRRMLIQEYNPTRSPWVRAYHLWRALLTWPPAIHALRDKAMLFPGWRRLRAGLRTFRTIRPTA